MTEDRLEKALEALRNERPDAGELSLAKERVLEKLVSPGVSLCDDFRRQFDDYRELRLDGKRRLLIEDHLARCAGCRAFFAAQKDGQGKMSPSVPLVSRKRRWGTWAAAAAALLAAVYFGYGLLDTLLERGPRATVETVEGKLYFIPEGALETGSIIDENRSVRTGPGSRAVLRLADGSRVIINERTELALRAARSGRVLVLQRGDIIVEAARQRSGQLSVQTRDSLASVRGTIFAVSSGLSGSLVSVIEGSVTVTHPWAETVLGPGEQTASHPALISSVREAISWSPDAESYMAILASLVNAEKQLAQLPSPRLRGQSALLRLIPANMVVYGAVPNMGTALTGALALVEQQAGENPALNQWWNSDAAQELIRLIGRIEMVSGMLGDEIIYGFSLNDQTREKIPLLLAEIKPGEKAALTAALYDGAFPAKDSRRITDEWILVTDTPAHLEWLLLHLGHGAETPFAREIVEHYRKATGWLIGIDMETLLMRLGPTPKPAGAEQIQYLFFEQQNIGGNEENRMTVRFKGPRRGVASFLADAGSGVAAEYISGDALAAAFIATREPRQLFDELKAYAGAADPGAPEGLSWMEQHMGAGFIDDLSAHFGTEYAFAIESLTARGPVWTLAAHINNPSAFESSLYALAESMNTWADSEGRGPLLTLTQDVADGRTWITLTFSGSPATITWTYDGGYLIAASERGAALRAIATRNAGLPLLWSSSFRQQLPLSAGLHPSGFLWLNTGGALQGLTSFISNPALLRIAGERDPILVVFSADTELISAASRTSVPALVMELLLLQGMGSGQSETSPDR